MLRLSILLLLAAAAAAGGGGVGGDARGGAAGNGTTVYELLPKFGLPPGLLPASVSAFHLAENGEFVVDLPAPCYVQFEYLVYYETRITGVVKYGGIESLKGIQVRRFLVWFDVDSIKVDLPPSDYIYFFVGWITKKLDVDQFLTVHPCQGNGVGGWARAAAKGILRIPSPLREADMLLTE